VYSGNSPSGKRTLFNLPKGKEGAARGIGEGGGNVARIKSGLREKKKEGGRLQGSLRGSRWIFQGSGNLRRLPVLPALRGGGSEAIPLLILGRGEREKEKKKIPCCLLRRTQSF